MVQDLRHAPKQTARGLRFRSGPSEDPTPCAPAEVTERLFASSAVSQPRLHSSPHEG